MNFQVFSSAISALKNWRLANEKNSWEFPDSRDPSFQKFLTDENLTAQDFEKGIVCLCCWREMRSQLYAGMMAVACVINNRAKKGWFHGNQYSNTVAKNQFSSMTVPGDPQLEKYPAEDDTEFNKLLAAIDLLYEGEVLDRTDGALYYAVLADSTSGWFFREIVNRPEEHPRLAEIGRTSFFG